MTYQDKGLFSIAITHFSEEYAALYRNNGALSFTDVCYPPASPAGPRLMWDGETLSLIWTTMAGQT